MHFLFDANMPKKLAEGLNILEQENRRGELKVRISHADVLCGPGATDEEVIKKAAELGAIIVSEDDDFKRIKSNKDLIKKHKLGYVLYKPPKHGSRYWEKVISIISGWEPLKEKIRNSDKPFIYKVNKHGEIQEEAF